MEKTLIIIDGSSFLYRSYYGLRPLHTKSGQPVHAVYGFCRMIKKLCDQFNPKHMILVWDSKGPTKRHELFDGYKMHRQSPPLDLFEQKKHIITFAESIHLTQLFRQGYEADDLMASCAYHWTSELDKYAIIVSSDKDMGQIISQSIVMYDFFKDIIIDYDAFQLKMGFIPEKTVFYFSLVGDAADAIPGVKGIGEKGAKELVNQFNSLNDLYDNLDSVKSNRMRLALQNSRDNAYLSMSLFSLDKNSIDNYQQLNMNFNFCNWEKAYSFFEAFEFHSLLKTIKKSVSVETSVVSELNYKKNMPLCECILITTEDQLRLICDQIKILKLFAYDTETDSLDSLNTNLVGISLCVSVDYAWYIPCGHITGESQLSVELIRQYLKPIFEDKEIGKIAHHGKFDQRVLSTVKIAVINTVFDTLIAAYLVKKDWQKSSLKVISEFYLNEVMMSFDEIVTLKKRKTFAEVPLNEAVLYAAIDACQTFKLYTILDDLLQKNNIQKLYYEIELPLQQILLHMELHGIKCDVTILNDLNIVVMKKMNDLHQKIISLLNDEYQSINLNSPKQIEKLLFDYLKLPYGKKTDVNEGYSTDHDVLVELAKYHPIPGYLIEYREISKLKHTYIDALLEHINPRTKMIHTTFSQTRVITGRLSSFDPNLQNIPASGLGSIVRMAFIPESGYKLLSIDYSQIELRILAYLSQDVNLKSAFLSEQDIHTKTAASIFQTTLELVTSEQRAFGKRINFSIIYGLTPYSLSKDLGISLKNAKIYIERYFEQYPGVRIWMNKIIEEVKLNGYVLTMSGRRRYIPGIYEKNKNLYDAACRIAINTIVQGTAADIMKLGMIRVNDCLISHNFDAYLLLQIHDEVVLSVSKNDIEKVASLAMYEFESVVSWNIPLRAIVSIGDNWKDIS